METKEVNGIKIREAVDLGPVIARADHRDGAIEVNRRIFYGLPPMVQEFVLCHEVCHLKYGEHDEAATNRHASRLFLDRANGEADRRSREDFLAYIDGKEAEFTSPISVTAILSIITGAVSLGTSVYGIIKNRNAGWYSWDDATKRANLETMLEAAFEESRKSSVLSAKDLFWQQLSPYDNKDSDTDRFLKRSDNAWVAQVIAKYEKRYGFKFDEVTPVDLTAFTAFKVGVGIVVGVVVFLVAKRIINR